MAYTGFKKLKEMIANNGPVSDPGAVAASVMKKKYKQTDISSHQQSATPMKNVKPKKAYG